jgi:hypothetical protein
MGGPGLFSNFLGNRISFRLRARVIWSFGENSGRFWDGRHANFESPQKVHMRGGFRMNQITYNSNR